MTADVVVVLTTLAALFAPGVAVGLSLGLRWSAVLGAAPVLTFGLVATAGSLASATDVPWTPGTLILGTLAGCGAVLAGRSLRRRWVPAEPGRPLIRRPERPSAPDLVVAAGVALGWAISATVLVRGFGGFDRPNQDWDYVFHSNALRLIADSDDVAPSAVRAINDWEVQSSFYPNAFHALGAVVRDLTDAPVFAVLNSLTLMITGVAGLGLALLLRSLRAPVVVAASTPVLLSGFASFPFDVLSRGPLLPFAMGIALVPAFFLVLQEALELPGTRRLTAAAGGAGLASAALLGVQTSAALTAALIAVPMLALRWVSPGRRATRDILPLLATGVTALACGWTFVVGALSMNSDGPRVNWPAVESTGQAVGDLLLLNHSAAHPQVWLAGLLLAGILALRSGRYLWWWAAGGSISVVLFVLSASSDAAWVESVTSPWWNDRFRFAAVAVLALAPLAAHGLHVLAGAAARLLGQLRRPDRWAGYGVAGCAAAGLAVVVLLSNGLYAASNEGRVAFTYQTLDHLSDAEVDAMHWLAEQPGAGDGQVMNDPNDGSPYMSALVGLQPVFGHILPEGSAPGEVQRLLLDHFNCLDASEELRAAVTDLDIRYLYLSHGYVREDWTRMRGLRGMPEVRSVEEVYDEGGVTIYRIDLTAAPSLARSACTIDEDN